MPASPSCSGASLVPTTRSYVRKPTGCRCTPAGCTCCAARGPAALALDRLFLDRVRGVVPWFDRVVVMGDGASVRQAVAEDAVAGSRFRLGQASRK